MINCACVFFSFFLAYQSVTLHRNKRYAINPILRTFCVFSYVRTHSRTYACMHARARAHTHIHTRSRTHTHTHIENTNPNSPTAKIGLFSDWVAIYFTSLFSSPSEVSNSRPKYSSAENLWTPKGYCPTAKTTLGTPWRYTRGCVDTITGLNERLQCRATVTSTLLLVRRNLNVVSEAMVLWPLYL